MEDLLTMAINSGNITAIVCAVILYGIIHYQRSNTKKDRDSDTEELKTKIALIENEIESIKSLDLASKLAQIQTDLTWIKEKLK